MLDPSYSDGDQLDGQELQQVPSILFNKYALDREESRRSKSLKVSINFAQVLTLLKQQCHFHNLQISIDCNVNKYYSGAWRGSVIGLGH